MEGAIEAFGVFLTFVGIVFLFLFGGGRVRVTRSAVTAFGPGLGLVLLGMVAIIIGIYLP